MINRIAYSLFTLLIAIGSVFAQKSFQGQIFAEDDNQPVPYASINIHETRTGVVADENGRFILQLPEATYTIEIRSIGYQSLRQKLVIDSNSLSAIQTYKLKPSEYTLSEVQVTAKRGKEDPAYRIMRQLIARAPIYERMLDSYKAEVYNKGSMRVDKVPFVFRSVLVDNVPMKEYLGRRYVLESQVAMEYESPNKYKQHVKAMRSSVPKQFRDSSGVMSVIATNLYGKMIGLGDFGVIPNPIRDASLSNYSFKLENTIREGDQLSYLISYKSKDTGDTSGELIVIDSIWCLQYIKLQSTMQGALTQKLESSLFPIQDGVFMPSTYSYAFSADVMGLKLDFQYYSSLSYSDMKLNDEVLALQSSQKAPLYKRNREVKKRVKTLQSRLDTLGYNLPDKYLLPDSWSKINTSTDSLATSRDSLYWQSIMTMPLSYEEQESYNQRDSLSRALDKKRLPISVNLSKRKGDGSFWSDLLLGNTYKPKKNLSIGFEGLLWGALHNYTYSDALWMGQGFHLKYAPSKSIEFKLDPSIYYSTKRRMMYWQVDAEMLYAPMSKGCFSLSAGRRSDEMQQDHSGNTRFINMFATLIDGRGVLNLVDNKYLSVMNEIDLLPGLQLNTSASYFEREALPFTRVWGINKKTSFTNALSFDGAKDNHWLSTVIDPQRSLTLKAELQYNPTPYYRIASNGRKVYDGQGVRSPLFTLSYTQGIPMGRISDSDYSLLSASVAQLYNINYSSHFYYRLQANIFLRDELINPSDAIQLKSFNSPYLMSNKHIYSEFLTMPVYSTLSSNNLLFFSQYGRGKMLLRHVPFLARFSSDERLHLKSHWSTSRDDLAPYFEAGYSIGLAGLMRLGVFYGGYNFVDDSGLCIRLQLNMFGL